LEQFLDSLISFNPLWIYFVACAVSYFENIFPPFPSDIVLVAAGYLCAVGRVELTIVLIVSTLGGTAGFVTMYKIGNWFGLRILETQKLKFIRMDHIHRVEAWFSKFGYTVVVMNRFLAGTRAVISFFTGMSNLPFWKTTFLAFISSLIWNAILLYAGNAVGTNWRRISQYLTMYGHIVLIISVCVILFFIGRNIFQKRKQRDIVESLSKSTNGKHE
jgi:membrane protein DedA with SNARE-associated domain